MTTVDAWLLVAAYATFGGIVTGLAVMELEALGQGRAQDRRRGQWRLT